MVVTGFGLTEHGTQSDELLSAELAYCPTEPCSENYKDLTFSEKQFCAVGLGLKKVDSCKGDSGKKNIWCLSHANLFSNWCQLEGGPVQKIGKTSINNLPRMLQYGIVSGGINSCGQVESLPGVYVKVTHYLEWIMDSVEKLAASTNKTTGIKCNMGDFAAEANPDEYGNRMSDNLMKSLAGFG